MKNSGGRFIRGAWFGFASVVLGSAFVACSSSSTSPTTTTPDAGTTTTTDDSSTFAGDSSVADSSMADGNVTSDASVVRADVTADFSAMANPNGAWTYGYTLGDPSAADAGALIVYSGTSTATLGVTSWVDPTNSVLGAPSAWRNDSASTLAGIAPGEFALHPGQAGEYSIARWTAPAAGTYAVTVQFKTGDMGDTNGLFLRNGVVLTNDESTSAETVHTLNVTVAAGDHLDVAVGNKGDFYYDSTPVRFIIDSAP